MRIFLITAFLVSASSVLAQTAINSSTFGMMEARWLGPGTMSGRITAIEGVALDGKTIYVGTAGGGIWKTTNAGASFKPVFDRYCQSIGAIAIDPQNPKIIYAGTGESNMRNSVSIGDGIYKSTDGGGNWTRLGLEKTEHIAKIVIDPLHTNVIYVAAPGPLWNSSRERGLYKSTDGGKTFEKILFISEDAGCADVAVDPEHPDTVYASTWEFRRKPYAFNSGGQGSGMWKSTDGGKTWNELKNGLPTKPFGRIAFAVAPSASQNLVAIVESGETGLYISADGGQSWKKQSATFNVVSRPFYFSTIVIDPKDPKRVYRPALSFSYSTDGGYSFAEASNEGGWVHSDHHALWINPNNTSQLYLGTDGGVYISLDRGVTWNFVQCLPVGQFYHVSLDNRNPYSIYGGLQDNGSWTGPSAAPGGVGNSSWKPINGGDGFWVQPDPTDSYTAYAESQGGNINRINLVNNKQVNIKPQQAPGEDKGRWNWNTPIVAGQANKKNLYIASQYLYKSTDQGRNWIRISPDLTTNDPKKQEQENSGGLSADNTSAENHCTIFTLTESPLDEKLIWVGTDDGNLQYTADAGKTWTNVAAHCTSAGIPAQSWVSSIEASRFDRNTVYATFDNHMYGDHQPWLAVSTDMGKTWKQISSPEFTGFAHKILQDRVNKDLLFLGTEMGLFATLDGGQNWFRMKNKIPEYVSVRDIQIHPRTNDLMIATHGRGILVIDDISPVRNLKKDIAEKDVVLFPPAPITLTLGQFGNGGFPSTGGWVAPNPPSVPPIKYYLKDRISKGEVKVEIYDAGGKLLQSIPAGKRKGVNMVQWNLSMKPPRIASGGSKLDFSGFLAPMVLPGEYTVKLKVADSVYTTRLKLVHDPADKNFTIEDRKKQYKTAMDLYQLHERLATLVDSINDRQKILKDNMDKVSDSSLKKSMRAYQDELEKLRAECLATKQKSVFADEKRLREEITEIYAGVTGQEAAPSNLQLQRTITLQSEVKKKEETGKQIIKEYDERVRQGLIKEGLILPKPVEKKGF
ncbi:MAG: glycosyl hydrolase [Sphingobacteriales bacterium]|nr:glycosyl hydrolase [Sphingobacteriales bacterium]